ncbi:hypothetical protein [Micrococcoides hystricis]|uniref:Uncharacterized protein n=1 Tax=Micrococcoides hystricis TaxID=1572761 RepID=A0ABV6P8Y8_9MICC
MESTSKRDELIGVPGGLSDLVRQVLDHAIQGLRYSRRTGELSKVQADEQLVSAQTMVAKLDCNLLSIGDAPTLYNYMLTHVECIGTEPDCEWTVENRSELMSRAQVEELEEWLGSLWEELDQESVTDES